MDKSFVQNTILTAAELLTRNAEQISEDFEKEPVKEITINIHIQYNEEPTIDITKIYSCVKMN